MKNLQQNTFIIVFDQFRFEECFEFGRVAMIEQEFV